MWPKMRKLFPDAVACLLMPEHAHGVLPNDAPRLAALGRLFQQHGRVFGTGWDFTKPAPCYSLPILRRKTRYTHLNPVREGVVDDPLVWPWSTLRDALGVVVDPWVAPGRMQRILRQAPRQLHAFTTSLLRPEFQTPLAQPDLCGGWSVSLTAVAQACASALRCRPDHLQSKGHPIRPTFVALARRAGNPRVEDLAAACHVAKRGVTRLHDRADARTVDIALRCLADARLHVCETPTRRQPAFRTG
jgi:hypothetical protein